MKKFLIAALACMSVLGMYAVAGSFTNGLGQVITVQTLTDSATAAKVATDYQDYSTYAGAAGKSGKIVRWYDYALLGGAVGTIYLEPKVEIPKGAVIRAGYIKVLTAVGPCVETSSNILSIASSGDVLAATTNGLLTTGIKAVVPGASGVETTDLALTADGYLYLTQQGAALTAGKFFVVLDYDQF